MADNWTVTSADKETITIIMNIDAEPYESTIGLSSLDVSTLNALQLALRSFAIAYRQEVNKKRPSALVDTAVGYTEDF